MQIFRLIAFMRSLRLASPLVVAALLITLLASASVAGSSQRNKPAPKAKPEPKVAIDKTKHDFGEVFAGEEVEHAFHVRNAGAAPLELSQKTLTAAKPAALPARLYMGFYTMGQVRYVSAGITPIHAAAMPAAPS